MRRSEICWVGIIGALGVPRGIDNGRRVIDICLERGLSVSNTYFEHKSYHKYTRVARGQDGVEAMSMIDLALVKKDMLHYGQDGKVVRGLGQGLSDHYVVLRKIRLVRCMGYEERGSG